MIPTKYEWILYVACAGLAWGTYVPLIFFGGSEFTTKPGGTGGRLMSILCVGIAYFVLAVLIPLGLFLTDQAEWPDMKSTGLIFSSLAGAAGAIAAICVIFASKAAVGAARESSLDPSTYRVFIAPIIFGLAPVINTLVSTVWHPRANQPFHFAFEPPGWKLWLGIVLVGAGAALVLFSKEEAEAHKAGAPKAPPSVSAEKQS